jgi:N-acetyl-gamma-glutamyl-phosphate reductase
MIKVGVIGGTGYTGGELLRLLAAHPEVNLTAVTSRAESGQPVSNLFPNLRGVLDIKFSEPDNKQLSSLDLVFFATPNGVAMEMAPALLEAGVRVIDLAADFRLKDLKLWQHWYGMPHACPNWLEQAVYGLCEINREQIKQAQLIANPGCYPTAVQLGLLPLLQLPGVADAPIVADCKSGASGAGRQAKIPYLLCEAGENFHAYAASGHRHLPEIKQGLHQASGITPQLTFVPHLTPMARGIHATLYAQVADRNVDLQNLFEQRYQNERFVDVMPPGSHPETRSVRASNNCRIAWVRPQDGDTVVVMSVIDNLVKGAAGQAVQNMNIMFGWDESTALQSIALVP